MAISRPSISIATDKGQYQQAEFRLSWKYTWRISNQRYSAYPLYCIFIKFCICLPFGQIEVKREFPFIHFGGQKGYEEAGNQAVGKLATLDMLGTAGLLVSRCVWDVSCIFFWSWRVLYSTYEIRCFAMGTLLIQKRCRQLAIHRPKMRAI